jgi:hypothetical protein
MLEEQERWKGMVAQHKVTTEGIQEHMEVRQCTNDSPSTLISLSQFSWLIISVILSSQMEVCFLGLLITLVR